MTCNTGSWLASGGFQAIGGTTLVNFNIVTGSLPLSTNWLSWKWNIKNTSAVTHTFQRTLNCFDLL
jgi:hypothetical protein